LIFTTLCRVSVPGVALWVWQCCFSQPKGYPLSHQVYGLSLGGLVAMAFYASLALVVVGVSLSESKKWDTWWIIGALLFLIWGVLTPA
jgi:hypothetical protein